MWPQVEKRGPDHKLMVLEQLILPGLEPVFGPPKNNESRTIHISAQTAELRRKHRSHQAELKMRNRHHYHDRGLVFAKEWKGITSGRSRLGHPPAMNNIGQREFQEIIDAAGVKKIRFHDMRHTCATLLLKAGVPVKVVSERLGHKRVEITLNIYQHVLPDMQEEAAERMWGILF